MYAYLRVVGCGLEEASVAAAHSPESRQRLAVLRYQHICTVLVSLLLLSPSGTVDQYRLPADLLPFFDLTARRRFVDAFREAAERRFKGVFTKLEMAAPGETIVFALHIPSVMTALERLTGLSLAYTGLLGDDETSPACYGLTRPFTLAECSAVRVVVHGLRVTSPVDVLAQRGRAHVYSYYWNELYLQESLNASSVQVATILQARSGYRVFVCVSVVWVRMCAAVLGSDPDLLGAVLPHG